MRINEKAKLLLLGRKCSNCIFLKKDIINPYELEYNKEMEKYQPNNLWIRYHCSYHKIILKKIKSHVCQNYQRNNKKHN